MHWLISWVISMAEYDPYDYDSSYTSVSVKTGDRLHIPNAAYRPFNRGVTLFSVTIFFVWLICIPFIFLKSSPELNPDGSIKPELIKQNNSNYIKVLQLLSTCKLVLDDTEVKFFDCPDGTKITQTKWVRDGRKGVVTRRFDKFDNEMSRYGHPNDL